ncbi:nuclease [Kitasatospora sp. NPDC056184]|uniref:nuclease n=1 Tax=Kitasatospora sp. NPDC056184 TaxID=3345738 RepID=UPI0035D79076
MLVIKGTYRIVDSQPDGDTVHFTPQDPGFWHDVPGGRRVQRNSTGGGTVRMDAIDALETHYTGVGPGTLHQPLGLGAHAARDELIAWLGFTGVVRNADEKVTASTPETVPGYVLAAGADVHGRAIALVGRGKPPAGTRSGERITVGVELLRETANHHLLARGLVYPTFYSSLPEVLRAELATVARQARVAKAPGSVWQHDVTTDGAKVNGLASITDQQVLLPKLFRRLADYLRLFGPALDSFPAYLAGEGEEFRVPEQRAAVRGLQHLVEVSGDTVRMTRPIEDVVLVEK